MTLLKDKNIDLPLSTVSGSAVKEAINSLSSLEFPTRRTEDWRYAKLGKIINRELGNPKNVSCDITPFLIPDFEVFQIVFVNGVLNDELSKFPTHAGVKVTEIFNLGDAELNYYNRLIQGSDEIFSALNTAYAQNGLLIEIGNNVVLDRPIYVINVSTGTQSINNLRNLIISKQGSEANLIFGYFGVNSSENFSNVLSEIFVESNAKLNIDKVQKIGNEDRQICFEEVYQEKDSTFKINTFQFNGEFLRNGLNIRVDGTNCHTEMNGFFEAKGSSYFDNHTRVDHMKSHCTSSEHYKGILKDSSTGVFNGKVIVHQDAQVIEAFQQNNNVILSDAAVMNTKPELEIYADDVKCSHGTTTGQFDEEALFYLQARGVSKSSAKEMMIAAFAEEIFEKIDQEQVAEFFKSMI